MKLKVDGTDVRMNEFVSRIIRNIMEGVLQSLDDIPEDPGSVLFRVETGLDAELKVDGTQVRVNAFVQKIIGHVLQGIVASLDDVPDSPRSVEVEL